MMNKVNRDKLKAEGQEGHRGWDGEIASPTNSMDMNLNKLQENSGGQGSLSSYSPWGCKELDTNWRQNNRAKFPNLMAHIYENTGRFNDSEMLEAFPMLISNLHEWGMSSVYVAASKRFL